MTTKEERDQRRYEKQIRDIYGDEMEERIPSPPIYVGSTAEDREAMIEELQLFKKLREQFKTENES